MWSPRGFSRTPLITVCPHVINCSTEGLVKAAAGLDNGCFIDMENNLEWTEVRTLYKHSLTPLFPLTYNNLILCKEWELNCHNFRVPVWRYCTLSHPDGSSLVKCLIRTVTKLWLSWVIHVSFCVSVSRRGGYCFTVKTRRNAQGKYP